MSPRFTEPAKAVVFASGRGTNLRAICAASKSGKLPLTVSAVVVNVSGAGAIDVAREFKVATFEIPHAGHIRASHEAKVIEALEPLCFDWIVLAGYMRLFTPEFVARFPKIVNIHPSLLPSFAGVDGYVQALRYGVRVTGATVHLVGAGLDDGPIVAQRALELGESETEESLKKKGLELEHALYVEALTALVTRPWSVSDGGIDGARPRVVFSGGRR